MPRTWSQVAFGLSKATWMGNPLPFDLAGLGAPGCQVLASADGGLFVGATGNTADLAIAVPNDRSLLGTTIYHQALVLDPNAGNALGAVVSNAAELVIGM